MNYRAAAKELATLRRDLWIDIEKMLRPKAMHIDCWNGLWLMDQHQGMMECRGKGRYSIIVPDGSYVVNKPLLLFAPY